MILINTKHVGLQIGYNIQYDLPHGFVLCLWGRDRAKDEPQNIAPRYCIVWSCGWEWLPRTAWVPTGELERVVPYEEGQPDAPLGQAVCKSWRWDREFRFSWTPPVPLKWDRDALKMVKA